MVWIDHTTEHKYTRGQQLSYLNQLIEILKQDLLINGEFLVMVHDVVVLHLAVVGHTQCEVTRETGALSHQEQPSTGRL